MWFQQERVRQVLEYTPEIIKFDQIMMVGVIGVISSVAAVHAGLNNDFASIYNFAKYGLAAADLFDCENHDHPVCVMVD